MPATGTKADAQRRADRIAAFASELDELERDGVLQLDAGQRRAVAGHHERLLQVLAREFDIDRSEPQRQMALGMRVASLLAAVALSAAVVLFFYRVWGALAVPAQLALLVAMPLALLAATELADRHESTGYVAAVLAVMAAASFALDLSVVGAIFNMTPRSTILAAWAAFALCLAYGYQNRLLLACGLGSGMGYVVALVATAAGVEWTVAIGRPEPLLVLGPLALAGSFWPMATRPEGFRATWRLMGCAALLAPLVFLSTWPEVFSYRLLPLSLLHGLYDAAGFLIPAALVCWAIRRRWAVEVNVASAFLAIFAFSKAFEWWWDVLPRYVFFLVLGGLAAVAMMVLARVRRRLREV